MSTAVAIDSEFKLNPQMLKYARTRAALSTADAAGMITKTLKRSWKDESEWLVSESDVYAWEDGSLQPTSSHEWAICRVYMYPYYGFWQDSPLAEPLTDFRSAPGGETKPISYESRRQLFRFDRFYELAKELGGRVGVAENYNVPIAGYRPPSEVAVEIRNALDVDEETQKNWQSDGHAFDVWKESVEKLGVYVISLPLVLEEFRGASRWDAGGPPAILVNTRDLPSAKNFTLLHELAHLTHRRHQNAFCDPTSKSHAGERRMNAIAAEALVPADWARHETASSPKGAPFKRWPVRERHRLRDTFNVSSQMLGIRLTELGITPSSGYAGNGWSKGGRTFGGSSGARPTRAERYRRYLGQPLVDLLRRALDKNAVGPGEALKHWLKDIRWDDLWKVAGYDIS